MSRQWIRKWEASIDAGGSTITIGGTGDTGPGSIELRARFRVGQNTLQTPNWAEVTITNLSDQTAKKIQLEGKSISLSAGYREAQYGLLFKGETIQIRKGRENPVDTYLTILATSGDKAYNHAVVSKTLMAGHTYKDQVNTVLEAMKPFGVTAGYIGQLGSIAFPRGRAFFGMARDRLREIAVANNMSWFIHHDKLVMLENQKAMPGDTVVLNSRTGLIGLPVQAIDGIHARCLLNPLIHPGSLVKIDQSSVQQAAFSPDYLAAQQNSIYPSIAEDGFYKVFFVEHHGDVRGTAWYTDITCVRADGQGQLPFGAARQGILVSP